MDELLQAVQAQLDSQAASTDAAGTGVYQAQDAAAQAQLDENMTHLLGSLAEDGDDFQSLMGAVNQVRPPACRVVTVLIYSSRPTLLCTGERDLRGLGGPGL